MTRDPVLKQIWKRIPHPKRHIVLQKLLRQHACICIVAVENGNIFVTASLRERLLNALDNAKALLLLILENNFFYRQPVLLHLPDLLLVAHRISADHVRCQVADISRAAEVAVEKILFCLRKILRKVQHDLRLRTPEAIDRLIVVPHHEKIVSRRRQKLYDVILKPVNVLKFIHKNVPEPVSPACQNIRARRKKLPGINHQIVVIKLSRTLHAAAIFPVNLPEQLFRHARRIIMLKRDTLVLHPADLARHIVQELRLVLDLYIHRSGDFSEKTVFFFLRCDVGACIVVCVSENFEEKRVKGSEADLCLPAVCQRKKALLHFLGGSPGEGNDQNMDRQNAALLCKVFGPFCDNCGFPGTGSCKNDRRTLPVHNRFLLCFGKRHLTAPALRLQP